MSNASSSNQEMEKSSECDYEVFLSFRGPDTRVDITDYLYNSMIDAGIQAYKDDKELLTGKEIGDQLLQAIEQSKILIPIFSKGYADSPWCLRELVKMVECKNMREHKIKPIFYDVAPSEVKHQTGHYGNAIVSHVNKNRFDDETINKWKATLTEVGALKGWDLHSTPKRGKGEFVKKVVDDVLIELKTTYLQVSDCLVEVDNHVDEVMRMIGTHNQGTKIVGIHGIGGMGKTTLAKIVYNRLSKDFVDCCFLSNVRETEITRLQNQLISDILKRKLPNINCIIEAQKVIGQRLRSKKVLLLLDDVDHATQLDALMQKREWFGKGSKIIITTRDHGILKVPTLFDGTYELTGMDTDHSLQLFSKHAFRKDYPMKQYITHSLKAVEICGGLPLAIEIVSSLLCGKSTKEWNTILKELEEFPQEDVQRKLMFSIEVLNADQRNIFLDVACFFIGFDKNIVIHMWESCKFCPHQSLEVLQQRSLIKIRGANKLWMHDWLRDIGRNIIQQRSGRKPEKQRRVWSHAQALEVLEKTRIGGDVQGIGFIEAICLNLDRLSQYPLIKKCLTSLSNLRLLIVDRNDFIENTESVTTQVACFLHYQWSNFLQTTFGSLILPELRCLKWNHFPMIFTLSSFSLRKLVILDLSMSKITEEWDGWSHIKLATDLKVLNLTECQELRKTPDLSLHVKLERLILERCQSLVQIGPSIGYLKKLVFLNLKYCCGLRKLPSQMGALESLTELFLDKTSIEEIPGWRRMKKLEYLSLHACAALKKFSFVGCAALADNHLTHLPKSAENFNSLIHLNLSGTIIQELPDSIGYMKNLRTLRMMHGQVRKLPSAVGTLEKLRVLVAGGCLREIPDNIGKLTFMEELILQDTIIPALPRLPESLINLSFHTTLAETLPDLSNLSNLRTLTLHMCTTSNDPSKLDEENLWWIGRLRILESLKLQVPWIATLHSDLILLSRLKRLELHCNDLQYLPMLPTNLSCLRIKHCRGIITTNDLSELKALSNLEIRNCDALTEIQGLSGLENLTNLRLARLPSLAKLLDLTNLKKLEGICISDCFELVEIRGCPESWKVAHFPNCVNLRKVPPPSLCKNIEEWCPPFVKFCGCERKCKCNKC